MTGVSVVDQVISDLGVYDITDHGLTLAEPRVTIDEMVAETTDPLTIMLTHTETVFCADLYLRRRHHPKASR